MTPLPRTAVVHLVWRAAGTAPFETFLGSYERHDAGAEHELVLLYNGFEDDAQLAPFRERSADLGAREIVLGEPCLDLRAYRQVVDRLAHERVCLLNSYSELHGPCWLALLQAPLAAGRTGASGATGSYASHLEYGLFQLGVRSRFAEAFESRRAAREVMHELSGSRQPNAVEHWLYSLTVVLRQRRGSLRFPAPHLRTNGLLIDRALFAELCDGALATKWATHQIESGPRSITARLRALGRPPVVVDRDGIAREIAEWHLGDVFRQADQAGLLISDNQTKAYAGADPRQRAVLSATAWGPWSRPG